MKVPSRAFVMAGLTCAPRETSANVVQRHLVKHPVGVRSLVLGGGWDDEGWSELGVIDDSLRARFVSDVLKLRVGREECAVPEIRGKTSQDPDVTACRHCPAPLADQCATTTPAPITSAYFGVLEQLLDALSSTSAQRIEKGSLVKRLLGQLRSIDSLADLVVMEAGVDAKNQRDLIVRLNRGDGVRAELYFHEPDQLQWRTLYRDKRAVSTPHGRIEFLGTAPPQGISKMALSDLCLVSRPFWQTP